MNPKSIVYIKDTSNYGAYYKKNDQYKEQSSKREGHNHEFQSIIDYEKDKKVTKC
ncbi:hypothetical protein [Clostridium sp.]|uniref:hypothetical protein n=1 Tax=Clostridium sp. TaxID=1506 RepID=UPI00283E5F93|nr:hypothetical protein [Clostridium sp.]MDR3596298.1 hypothetical protein [Clostridium sp.]